MTSQVYFLQGEIQQYAWGKVGSTSAVARLCSSADSSFEIVEDQPYAELWMGAHSKAPSRMLGSEENLLTFIEGNPSSLGPKVEKEFGSLPFLFKVLSVAKSLSIQAHPNKALAEKLHLERPDIYRDANHKPEMAIALTQFEALCGFRPISEVIGFFDAIPELECVVGKPAADRLRMRAQSGEVADALKDCFGNVILCEKSTRENKLNELVQRINKMKENREDLTKVHGELLLRVHSQFPADVGCFVIYFLNHIMLEPGEAIFLGANVPHAYLSGDCIECMACSDNVVRAGLTPKLVDASTLCEMLEYEPTPAAARKFSPEANQAHSELVYNPPVDDFAVMQVQLDGAEDSYTFRSLDSASIILFVSADAVTAGSGNHIRPGSVVFLPANVPLKINNNSHLLAYRASCFL